MPPSADRLSRRLRSDRDFVLQGQARPEWGCFTGKDHPGSLVELASGSVLPSRPDSYTLTAHRARNVEDVKDQWEPDSCTLRGGANEHHRDVQERWIGISCSVIEPSRLGQRHPYDVWLQSNERQRV